MCVEGNGILWSGIVIGYFVGSIVGYFLRKEVEKTE
jgi:uncharacterized membrane protein